MTDTITMSRAEYDETTAQLRYQAREIERLRAIAECLDEAELENAESRAVIVDLRAEVEALKAKRRDAAPELLSALKAFEVAFRTGRHEPLIIASEVAQIAIAKAEGAEE